MHHSQDNIAKLERARELLDAGESVAAAKLLKAHYPAAFAREKDYLSAECLRSQGFFDRAARLYRKVLRAGPGCDADLWLESSLALASVHRSLGQVRQARRILGRGLSVLKVLRKPGYQDRFALEEALVDRAEGRYAKSLAKLSRFLARAKREEDWSASAFLLWAMGGARRFSGDLAGAHRDFQASLSLAGRARDSAGQAYALFGLGGVSRIQGRLERSRDYYAQAGRRLAQTQDLFGQAYAHCGLANSLRQLGQWRQASRHYKLAHRLYSRLEDYVDLAYVDWGLGAVALKRGELPQARNFFERALKAFRAGRETRGVVLAEIFLANLCHVLGRTREGESLFKRAVRRSQAAGLHAHLEVFT